MLKFTGSKDIKIRVNDVLHAMAPSLRGKVVVDIPAGSGVSTKTLLEIGARVQAYDLFPSFLKVDGVQCQFADLSARLPIESASAEVVLCQEGIEHVSDQLFMLNELNRILRKNGTLLLTTPNYSNLRSRLSYFLSESEYYRQMPPNIIDSVWFAEKNVENKIYFGHIFLIGIQKLNLLARLSGFQIKSILPVRANFSSLLIFPLFYPLIVLRNWATYRRAMRKNKHISSAIKKKVYEENLKYNFRPSILLGEHLFIEFEKVCEVAEANDEIKGVNASAGFDT